jgi:HEAT repeat protein
MNPSDGAATPDPAWGNPEECTSEAGLSAADKPATATKRIPTAVLLIVGACLPLFEIGCSLESVPADRRRQKEAALSEYERQQQETSAAEDRQRAEERQRRLTDPGSLSIQESDAEIAALHSPSSLRRTQAAEKLGDAKGTRAVDSLIAVLRTESDPLAFSAVVQAMENIHDARAVDAYVEALSAPNMPDYVREMAFNGIVASGSQWRFVPQIRHFYSSLTDESVRARVRLIVEQYTK